MELHHTETQKLCVLVKKHDLSLKKKTLKNYSKEGKKRKRAESVFGSLLTVCLYNCGF